jgi:hypothetical protein
LRHEIKIGNFGIHFVVKIIRLRGDKQSKCFRVFASDARRRAAD